MPKTIPVPETTKLLIRQYAIAHPEMSARKIAKQVGLCPNTVGKILNAIPDNGKSELTETSELRGDDWVITLPRTRIQTLDELLTHCKVDLSVWDCEKFTCNKWEVGAKDAAGKIVVEPLFQVKAFLKKKKDVAAVKNEIAELKVLAKTHPWPAFKTAKPSKPSGLLLEINTPDLHVGKLSWGLETGGPNYDVKIAEATFWKAFETLLSRVSNYKFDEVLFVLGNDLMNADDIEGRTTAGTYVSSDARYHKTFAATRTLAIKAIERLKRVAPVVRVLPVYGNHDRLSSWHIGDSVEMYFTRDKSVIVDNRPRARKYFDFGRVLLMFTHGDKGKRTDYPLLMATEEPELFGKALFRECHTGHTHMTKLDEQHGVRVRVLPALCPADDWHSLNGFVGNKRSAEAYVWDREEGLITVVYHTEKD